MGSYKEEKLKTPVEVIQDVPLRPRQKRSPVIPLPWDEPSSALEKLMKTAKRGKVKLPRKVEWRSEDGKMVVISGPFPRGFLRSETRTTVLGAAKQSGADLWARDETERDDRYAKCLAEDIVEVLDENEFGTVSP